MVPQWQFDYVHISNRNHDFFHLHQQEWGMKPDSHCLGGLGPVSLTVFPSQFQFDGNFVSLSSRFWYSDRYKILYMARQLCCRGMCKNLLRSDSQQRNYSKAKFPSNWNCGQKIVSETGPWHVLKSPKLYLRANETRTTRMPAFWGYPAASWLPILLSYIGAQVKRRLSQSYIFKEMFEFWNKHYTRHTFWSCLIRCANMKWIQQILLKIQSWQDSVQKRTDGRTKWNQYTPLSTSLKRRV